MSRASRVIALKRTSVLAGIAVAILVGGTYLQAVVRLDPFAPLKKTSRTVDPNLGVRLEGVSLESYEGEKLVLTARMKRMDVRQDRQFYDIEGVEEGTFYSSKGVVKFSAPTAEWNVLAHELDAPNAHVVGKDFNLAVPRFAFKSDKGTIHIPGEVSGKIGGGDVKALGVQYNVNDGTYSTGHIRWSGKIALSLQDGRTGKPTEWHIEGDSVQHKKGNIDLYKNGVGDDVQGPDDADGIIVMADQIEHNRNTDVVTATGNVRYFSSKANMVCEKAVIERRIKKATMTGNVQMLLKAKEKQITPNRQEGIPPYRPVVPDQIFNARPKADESGQTEEQKKLDEQIRSGKNMHDYPTICYAEKIVYWYKKGERHADISGNPQARQELQDGAWRQIWTNTAFYDGENETLKLASASGAQDTRLVNSIGDDLVAETFTVSTKEGDDEEWSGTKVKGRVMDYDNERERPTTPTKVGGTVPPPAGGGQKPPPPNRTQPGPLTGRIGGKKKG